MPICRTITLGIDGGGTSTRAIASDGQGKIFGRGVGTGCNPNNVGVEAAARAIDAALDGALGCLKGQGAELVSACFGIAGLASDTKADALRQALLELSPHCRRLQRLRLTHDLEIAHFGAFGGAPGICLIAGTGSACYGKRQDGSEIRASGRSYAYEDPGSGYAIGQKSIEAGFADTPPTSDRASIAALSPRLLEAAERGNRRAIDLLQTEAGHLISMAAPVLESIGDAGDTVPVVFVGGLLERESLFQSMAAMELSARFPRARLMEPLGSPLQGALQIAQAMAFEKQSY